MEEIKIRNAPLYYKKRSFNSVWKGFWTGLVLPVVVFAGYYVIFHRQMLLISFFKYLNTGNIFMPIISLCVVPNLLLFYVYIWTNRDKSARGVVTAVILYALFLAVMKMA